MEYANALGEDLGILLLAQVSMIHSQHLTFLRNRRRLVRFWPIAGIFIWSLLALLTVYLWHNSPQLINFPWVATQITQGILPVSTLEIMALMLPILTITLLSVLALMVLFGFAINQIEKRYLKILAEHSLLPD